MCSMVELFEVWVVHYYMAKKNYVTKHILNFFFRSQLIIFIWLQKFDMIRYWTLLKTIDYLR